MSTAPNDRFKMLVAVHFVIYRDQKILLGLRQNTGWSDGLWHLIGGHVEEGEMITDAVIREAREELGIEVNRKSLRLVHVRSILRPSHSRLHMFFHIEEWQGQIENKEPDKNPKLNWFDVDSLPENTTEETKINLQDIRNNINYSEIVYNHER